MNMNILGIAIVVALVIFVVLLKMASGDNSEVKALIRKELEEARTMVSKDVSSQKMAVIKCDVLLGRAFKLAGISGDTVGEQLKKARNLFSKGLYEDVWFAHKLRNRFVHENTGVSTREAVKAVSVYTSAIRHLVQ